MKKILISLLKKFGYSLQQINGKKERLPVINRGKEIIKKISPDFSVLNGPFKGMKYPSIDITELTLVPKISGSYERQLEPVIKDIISQAYENIIDVGCAEGYYAVGLAMKIPQSTVHCYDINEADLAFCKQMADLNHASNLTYNNFCSAATLQSFNYGKRSLVISDCEGYELQLFTSEAIKALVNTDVLIELHDVIDPTISKTLTQRFSGSHDIRLLNNFNVNYSDLQGLDHLTPADKAFAVYEHRGGLYQNIFMEWAFFTPKNRQ